MFVDIDSEHWHRVSAVVSSEGLELYDLELSSGSAQVTIFSPNGVKSEDCTRVCKRLLVQSSVEDLGFNSEAHIEVHSPGVNRRLRVLSHYESALEQNVKVVVNTELLDDSLEFPSELIGTLKSVDSQKVIVEVGGSSKKSKKSKDLVKKEWEVPLKAVKKARIDFIF